jgi:hypothetical protein
MSGFVVITGGGWLDHLTEWNDGNVTTRTLCGQVLGLRAQFGKRLSGIEIETWDERLCAVCRRVAL